MEYIINVTTITIQTKYKDGLPTLEQINSEADFIRSAFLQTYPITDDELIQVKNKLSEDVLHSIGGAVSLKGKDSDHQAWYHLQENDGFYWERYRTYLKTIKHWGAEIVNRLGETTDDVMNDLGNPKDSKRPFQRRGLLLGDVQSGKTATYTAICNKASDAGYRVIIVLAGMMENLRIQTQERLDAEFVGIESKYALDKKADNEIRNIPVGVGKIPPHNQDKRIACFTSVSTDFNKSTLKALGLSLRTLNGTALFVVKKNKSVLNNLYKWLVENNADHESGLINLPLLLIDDEADNASVNTNSEEKDPTAINKAIRDILYCFQQATYLGITATPFANIFINPEPEIDENTRDLFPKDFLTVLPTPQLYIGADKIFGSGNADEWEAEGVLNRVDGPYSGSLIPIENEEQESFFKFKHKKEIADTLSDIPLSLRRAIGYFILATAISDYRKDNNEHRSMLVNVSRFTMVQNQLADLISGYVTSIRFDIENYSQLSQDKTRKITNIAELETIWDEFGLKRISGTSWQMVLKDYLLKAIRRVEVRSVNQSNGAFSLNYYEYKNTGMRVIAVGGNSLSRGLTLEGLCVSYFYRNTMMYDTLLQMGRWFGYRPHYDDLFKIWMAEDAINWYGFITDALNELKIELKKMERQNQTPSQFGLKVRQAPELLLITARNKMRAATAVNRPVTVSGRMIETPRLRADLPTLEQNERLCRSFIKALSVEKSVGSYVEDEHTKAIIWRNVPKRMVIEVVRNFVTHPWNLNFQPIALADYIGEDDETLDLWDVAIPQSVNDFTPVKLEVVEGAFIKVYPRGRPLKRDPNTKNMLKVYGQHVRIGAGGCTKIGLTKDEIDTLREKHQSSKDSTFLNTHRHPLLLLHILYNTNPEMGPADPEVAFALGLGFPYNGRERTANYMVNVNELKNWIDVDDRDEDDDDND